MVEHPHLNNHLFVPVELRPQVIHWAHTSLLSCHPGVKRTMFIISRRFWWSATEPEVRENIEACSVCAHNKTSCKARTGLLQLLPIPSRPRSDISMDFVTGLLVSQGNTTILTVVDRFSKMVKFIALPKLPSAKETTDVMMNQVFRVHGFLKDIVSDRGPQIVSRFWKEFCRLIGARASLTSGCHPDQTPQPAIGNRPPMRGAPEPLNMEQTPGLGRVCSQFVAHLCYWPFSFSLCPRLPTPTVSRQ